ncbi:MAG: hypothetical protein GY924_27975 [Planctomycetaceae bacterium]|nr:hypothetical protein [Planctomycetaceae bacterium]
MRKSKQSGRVYRLGENLTAGRSASPTSRVFFARVPTSLQNNKWLLWGTGTPPRSNAGSLRKVTTDGRPSILLTFSDLCWAATRAVTRADVDSLSLQQGPTNYPPPRYSLLSNQ